MTGQKRRRLAGAVVALAVVAGLLGQTAQATSLTWDSTLSDSEVNDGSGTWADGGAYWWYLGMPTLRVEWNNSNSDVAVFGAAAGTDPYTVTLGGPITAGGITFANRNYTIAGTSTLTLNGSITANDASGTINAPITLGANQTWAIGAGKTLTIGSAINNNGKTLGITGTGTLATASNLTLNTVAAGTNVNANGGTLTLATNGGFAGNLVINAAATVNNGAYHVFGNRATQTLHINGGTLNQGLEYYVPISIQMTGGAWNGNDARLDPGGGVITVNPSANTATINAVLRANSIDRVSTFTFNVADGAAAVDLLYKRDNGLGGSFNGTFATNVTKSGAGLMEIAAATTPFAGALAVNGGVLRLTGLTTFAGTGITVSNAGTTLQLNAANASDNFAFPAKPITLNAGTTLSKTGPGKIKFAPASGTFDGNVTVEAGALYVNSNALAAKPITVNGGFLGGNNSVGATTVVAGGGIEGGSDGTGALTLDSLTFGAAGKINAMLAAGATPIVVTNALSTAGAGSVTVNLLNTSFPPDGTYHLLSCGSSASAESVNAFKINHACAFQGNGNYVDVNVNNSVHVVWSGSVSSEWSTNALASPKNWALSTDASAADFMTLDAVRFDDTAAGSTVVDISQADVTPRSVVFSNSAKNYTLQGSKAMATGSLTKSGTGTLTVRNANAFTAGATISQGTINVTNSNALGTTGAITLGDVNTGASAAALRSTVNFSRDITVSANGTGPATIAGDGNLITFSGALSLNRPTILGGTAGDRYGYSGKMSGNVGTLTIDAPRITLEQSAANAPTFTGSVVINPGKILQFNSIYGLTASHAVRADGSLYLNIGNGGTATIGSLHGNGYAGLHPGVTGTQTLSIGGDNRDGNFSGTLSNGGGVLALTKTGAGTQVISGIGAYSGATTIRGGKLVVNGSTAAASAVQVQSGATLGGTGTAGGTVTVNNGGAVQNGYLLPGTLTAGALVLESGATANVTVTGAGPGINVTGALTTPTSGTATLNATVPFSQAPGTFVLVDYTGEAILGGDYAGFARVLSAPGARFVSGDFVNNVFNSSIDLNVTAIDYPVWTGAQDGDWDIENRQNWKLFNANTATHYQNGEVGVFGDTAGARNINLTTTVNPSVVMVTNSGLNDYVFGGSGKISGATGLTKTGDGSLTISNAANDFTGPVTINGGTIAVGSISNAGAAGPLGAGTNLVLGGGSLRYTGADSGPFTNRSVTLNHGGGIVRVDNAATNLTLSGEVSGAGTLTKTGAGTLTLSSVNTHTGGTALSGGTLAFVSGGLGTTGNIAVTGVATLQWSGANSQDISGRLTIDNGAVVTMDTMGNNVTFASAFGGGGSGGLTKTGAGVLTLSAVNTYSGPTAVTAGKLQVNGSLKTEGSVSVAAGATLGGAGSAGATAIADGGILEPGQAGAGTLTLASLIFHGAGAVNVANGSSYEFSAAIHSGDLTTEGPAGLVVINVGGAAPLGGTYRLIGHSGSVGGTGYAAFKLGDTPTPGPRGASYSLVNNPGSIDLSVVTDYPTWTGGNPSGEWSTGPLSPANWKLAGAGTDTDFMPGDAVLFGNAVTGTSTVNLSAANVQPGRVMLNNDTDHNYTLQGPFSITGPGRLSKSGTGRVTITSANLYTGGTTLNGGTLSFANNSLGTAGPITFDGSATLQWNGTNTQDISSRLVIANDATATFDIGANNVTFASTFGGAGTGGLTKTGSGTLTLNGYNTFTGNMTVDAGSVKLQGGNGWTPAGQGTLIVNSGAVVEEWQHNQLGSEGPGYMTALKVNGGTFLTDQYTHFNSITMTGGAIGVRSGIVEGTGLDAHTFHGATPKLTTLASADIATISAKMTISDPLTFDVADGTAVTDLLYSGVVVSALPTSTLTKTGAGKLTLSAANTYSSGTTVSKGTLELTNPSAAGSGLITLGDGHTGSDGIQLTLGAAAANSVTVSDQGTGPVTIYGNSQYKTLTGTLTLNRPASLSIPVSGGGDWWYGFSRITGNAGTLTITGDGILDGANRRITFNAPNDFTGDVLVTSNAMLQLNPTGNVPPTSNLTVESGGYVRLPWASAPLTVNGLFGAGNIFNDNNSSSSITVGLNNGDGEFSGTITQQAGLNLSFTKAGAGTQVLSGAASYTGPTTVTGGILRLGPGGSLNPRTAVTVAPAGDSATFDVGGHWQTIAGLTLGGSLETSAAAVTTGSGILTLNGDVTYDAAVNPAGATISSSESGGLDLGYATRIFTVGDSLNASADLTVSSPISAAGIAGLTKAGDGMLVLSGLNTYNGGTQVTAGMLQVSKPGALPAGQSLTIDAGANVVLSSGLSAATAEGSGHISAAPVPEPGTITLAIAAMAGLLVLARRRRTV